MHRRLVLIIIVILILTGSIIGWFIMQNQRIQSCNQYSGSASYEFENGDPEVINCKKAGCTVSKNKELRNKPGTVDTGGFEFTCIP